MKENTNDEKERWFDWGKEEESLSFHDPEEWEEFCPVPDASHVSKFGGERDMDGIGSGVLVPSSSRSEPDPLGLCFVSPLAVEGKESLSHSDKETR